ncbi:MAG: helix-turn-helix transcriptional regulator [Pseudomonadota bacterium]|nr:helix-turn-helix transcriptional regulator [Pseudomonadota bacterium]
MSTEYAISILSAQAEVSHWRDDRSAPRRYIPPMTKVRHFYLKQWRKHRGLTQQQLAEAIGMTKGYISNLETGEKRYNEDLLEDFARVLRCEPWELVARNPLDDSSAEIVSIWDHIDTSQRKLALDVLKTFTGKKQA